MEEGLGESDDELLVLLAEDFAENLRSTIAGSVECDVAEFECTITPSNSVPHEAFAVVQSHPSPRISLVSHEDGDSVFGLSLEYRLFLGKFLTVESSKFEVGLQGADEPLFRYEYIRRPQSRTLPTAHMHVHAHRDQFLHGMMLSGRGRSKQRNKDMDQRKRLPYLSNIHFPLGGPRFRPSIEDVLEMLIHEFGVHAKPNATQELANAREKWRIIQLKALVRRNLDDVFSVLNNEGYDVTPRAGVTGREGADPALRLY